MPAGLRIINESNVIQVDGDYSNLALRASGVLNSGFVRSITGGYNGASHIYRMQVQADEPVICYEPRSCSLHSITRSGTTCTVDFSSSYFAPDLPQIKWWLFDRPRQRENFGIEVFRQDGALAFTSAEKYLRVVGVYSFGFPVPAGRTYAIMQRGKRLAYYEAIVESQQLMQFIESDHYGGGSTLVHGPADSWVSGPWPENQWPARPDYHFSSDVPLVVDVTGY